MVCKKMQAAHFPVTAAMLSLTLRHPRREEAIHPHIQQSRAALHALDRIVTLTFAMVHEQLHQWRKADDDPDGDGDDFSAPDVDFPAIAGRSISFSPRQLQKKYQKHAPDFGFPKNYNPQNAQKFADVLKNFINNPETMQRTGSYRGQASIHYLNHETRMNVTTYPDGKFWTAFKLGSEQFGYWPHIKRRS